VSHSPRRLAVVAASDRAVDPLVATASRSGWRTVSASTEQMDPLAMTTMLLDATVHGILVGANDPPAADERRALGELAALIAAVAERRPDLVIVLAGGMSDHLPAFGDVGRRKGEVVLGPPAKRGVPGGPLADLLLELALPPERLPSFARLGRPWRSPTCSTDAWTSSRSATTREPGPPPRRASVAPRRPSISPSSRRGLAPPDPDDTVVDRVGLWSTWGADRHRLRDRLRELRIAPWSDATADGATLRMAAARAALGRCRMDARVERPAAGRTSSSRRAASGPSRRPEHRARARGRPPPAGACQFALDHARILAPLGSIPDADERRAMIADLVDDLLAPLGTFVTPAGMRPVGAPARSSSTGRRRVPPRPDARRPRARRPAARDRGRGRVPVPRPVSSARAASTSPST
jgi:hypothetical protein